MNEERKLGEQLEEALEAMWKSFLIWAARTWQERVSREIEDPLRVPKQVRHWWLQQVKGLYLLSGVGCIFIALGFAIRNPVEMIWVGWGRIRFLADYPAPPSPVLVGAFLTIATFLLVHYRYLDKQEPLENDE